MDVDVLWLLQKDNQNDMGSNLISHEELRESHCYKRILFILLNESASISQYPGDGERGHQ